VEGRTARVTSGPLLTRVPAHRRHRVGFTHASTRYTRVTTLSARETLEVATQRQIQFVDLTPHVATLVRSRGRWDGTACVYSRHTTAAVRIQENEPLLLEDFGRFLARLAPPDADYAHNDFGRRTSHMRPDESPNGHAHCLHLLLGASSSIPVLDGALQLGEWQRIFLVELDGPRPRRDVIVGLTGVLRPSTRQLR